MENCAGKHARILACAARLGLPASLGACLRTASRVRRLPTHMLTAIRYALGVERIGIDLFDGQDYSIPFAQKAKRYYSGLCIGRCRASCASQQQ